MARGRTSRSGGKKASAGRRGAAKAGDPAKEDTRPMEERLKSIEYHWETFAPLARRFLLRDPRALTLEKLLDFFSRPDQIAFADMPVSVGTAHMLAYEYFNVGARENARALALCGAFFQQAQCKNTPIEKMMVVDIKDVATELPLYHRGVQAIKDDVSTSSYLKRSLPLKYQKIMGLKSHTQNAPGRSYTNLIADDWNGAANSKKVKHQNESSEMTEIAIVISNKDDGTEHKQSIKMDTTLKTLFNGYADLCGASLRSLRFAYNESTLFLSSVGQKTPLDMGMKDMDMIVVSNNQLNNSQKSKEQPASPPKAQKKKKTKSQKGGRGKRGNKKPATTQRHISLPESDSERDKVTHSKLLSKVFEEMSPKLKVIRRQLNDMVLDRQSSKIKKANRGKRSPVEPPSHAAFNPSNVGIGGKAGKTRFVINVGRVENLYKTSKRRRALPGPPPAALDLHGCTRDEALARLGAGLEEWTDAALRGAYPWVMPAVVVCGGGDQILSETVEGWIRRTRGVANAPKGSVCC